MLDDRMMTSDPLMDRAARKGMVAEWCLCGTRCRCHWHTLSIPFLVNAACRTL